MKTLADRLTWARIQKEMTQQELAKAAGMAQSTVGGLETGVRMTARKVAVLAGVLGVNSMWLAEGNGQPGDAEGAGLRQVAQRPRARLQWVEDDEAELLSQYRAMEESSRGTVRQIAESLPKSAALSIASHKP